MRGAIVRLFAAGVAVGIAGSASAASLNWTGCYVGGNAGWIGSASSIKTNPSGTWLTNGTAQSELVSLTRTYNPSNSSIEAGVQIGCNHQSGRFVVGGEADLQWTGLKDSISDTFPRSPGGTFFASTVDVNHKLSWYSTYRIRAGHVVDRAFLYLTGGIALGRVESDTSRISTTNTYIGSYSAVRVGWTVGAGAEYALTNQWSLKAEYLYLDFGSFSYESPQTRVGGLAATFTQGTTIQSREHVARLGVNYRVSPMK